MWCHNGDFIFFFSFQLLSILHCRFYFFLSFFSLILSFSFLPFFPPCLSFFLSLSLFLPPSFPFFLLICLYDNEKYLINRFGEITLLDFKTYCVCSVAQSHLTLCNPMDCSPPGSSVHGVILVRILEGLFISPPGDLPDPGIEPVSPAPLALADRFFTTESPEKPQCLLYTTTIIKVLWHWYRETWMKETERKSETWPKPLTLYKKIHSERDHRSKCKT